MSRRTTPLFKAGLSALHYLGVGSLAAPGKSCAGAIFMLHRVRPEPPEAFEPNRILAITPAFLETAIREVSEAGFDIVSLDEMARRLSSEAHERPFACFTFDDGYRDNREFAYPIFAHHRLPFAIYVAPAFAEGNGDLWWLVLEKALRRSDNVTVEMDGKECSFETRSVAEKDRVFHVLYWWLRAMPERQARAEVARLARDAGYDPSGLCRELVMSWDETRELARDPLVTIGAHTCNHFALGKLSLDEARREIADCKAAIERELGRPCRHLSYPYGDETSASEREFTLARELGFATAVTTRKGLIPSGHHVSLTALPRVSLNGDFQDARYLRVLLSGVPFTVWEQLKRLPVAARAAYERLRESTGAAPRRGAASS